MGVGVSSAHGRELPLTWSLTGPLAEPDTASLPAQRTEKRVLAPAVLRWGARKWGQDAGGPAGSPSLPAVKPDMQGPGLATARGSGLWSTRFRFLAFPRTRRGLSSGLPSHPHTEAS